MAPSGMPLTGLLRYPVSEYLHAYCILCTTTPKALDVFGGRLGGLPGTGPPPCGAVDAKAVRDGI